MTATYTFDVFSSVDGFGSFSGGGWGGYWGKEGPEFLAHRLSVLSEDQRLVVGANTYRDFVHLLHLGTPGAVDALDPINRRMVTLPTVVVSRTLDDVAGWPGARLERGDGVEAVRRMKAESDVPLRSHGSLSLNRALLAAGLVDRIELTVFPVITGITGTEPVLRGAADLDLELLESRTFDGRVQRLVYRPYLH